MAKPNSYFTDLSTGEITHALVEFRPKKQWLGKFSLLFPDHLWRLRKMGLSGSEYDFLTLCLERASKETGEIIFNATKIARELKISRTTIYSALNKLLAESILIRNGDQILVDARFYWSGNTTTVQAARAEQHQVMLVGNSDNCQKN